mmetsp:Transcript_45056/g.124926  ORF Transcript_45056/g.124926 Transcript_45056/m.124926 type:complete len:317 (-) Transcript_45056:3-953(-)
MVRSKRAPCLPARQPAAVVRERCHARRAEGRGGRAARRGGRAAGHRAEQQRRCVGDDALQLWHVANVEHVCTAAALLCKLLRRERAVEVGEHGDVEAGGVRRPWARAGPRPHEAFRARVPRGEARGRVAAWAIANAGGGAEANQALHRHNGGHVEAGGALRALAPRDEAARRRQLLLRHGLQHVGVRALENAALDYVDVIRGRDHHNRDIVAKYFAHAKQHFDAGDGVLLQLHVAQDEVPRRRAAADVLLGQRQRLLAARRDGDGVTTLDAELLDNVELERVVLDDEHTEALRDVRHASAAPLERPCRFPVSLTSE